MNFLLISADVNVLTTLMSLLLIYSLFRIFKKSKSNNEFQELISPFFATDKNKRITLIILTFIIVIFIIIPLLAYFFHLISNTEINFNDYFSIVGIWFSLFGVMFTLRVFLEIKTKSQHNFEEFVSVLLDMINRSRTNDKLYLILPTLFIGALGHKEFHDSFCSAIKKLAMAKGSFNIAILDYSIDKIRNLRSVSEKLVNKKEADDIEGLKIEFLKLLYELNQASPLIKFHYKWNTNFKNEEEKTSFFYNLSKFICELEEIASEPKNGFKIHKIKSHYFTDSSGEVAQGSSGLFFFANSVINIYYLGNITIKKQEDIVFQNAIIENIVLETEIENIYNKFTYDTSNPC